MTSEPAPIGDLADVRAVIAEIKPKLRGWLHTVTAPLALGCGVILVALAPTDRAAAAAGAFALTAFVLFTTSAIYHRGHWTPRVESRLKKLDHANIFLLIAGSYTPFAVLGLSGTTRIALLASVWTTALAGAAFRVIWIDAPRRLYVGLYIGLGWSATLLAPQLISGAGLVACILLGAGGLLYTGGAVVYGTQRPNPSPRWFGFHEIFHACTVAAFACQYIAASLLVYRAA